MPRSKMGATPGNDVVDSRADDHTEPLVELRRLYDVAPQHDVDAPGGTTRP